MTDTGSSVTLIGPRRFRHTSSFADSDGRANTGVLSEMEIFRQLTPEGLRQALRRIVCNIPEINPVPFPNLLNPPVLDKRMFIRDVDIPSDSRADAESFG